MRRIRVIKNPYHKCGYNIQQKTWWGWKAIDHHVGTLEGAIELAQAHLRHPESLWEGARND